ncbi:TPA: peptide deformylase [Morganella morganii]|uniref:peptide deformylase n=1 Tax=Morganella morganii TaxID=582 RepID=UPI0005FC2DBD|nr:peptide deformylase [Morganella morganii]ELA7679374.1 peptide deformylase [Morganella morganii]KJY03610.1 Peptide deformylase 1 [Morganella morganii]MBT0361196.1 peptide deformylase [Morganella morganii subsp. morganii]MDU2632145.1 peptide deformylase [Morganella morganii]UXJ03423.1 peptide deformylase [Morganella morganii]
MALLTLRHFPDPCLRETAQPVTVFDDELKTFVTDMTETMYAERGIGLAAPQVGVCKRMIIVDISENRDQPMALINPEFIQCDGEMMMMDGCLSLPESYTETQRYSSVTVRYQDINGAEHTLEAEGLQAGCLQHEIDHLNGKLFIDHLSPLKRQRIEKKVKKTLKMREENA